MDTRASGALERVGVVAYLAARAMLIVNPILWIVAIAIHARGFTVSPDWLDYSFLAVSSVMGMAVFVLGMATFILGGILAYRFIAGALGRVRLDKNDIYFI